VLDAASLSFRDTDELNFCFGLRLHVLLTILASAVLRAAVFKFWMTPFCFVRSVLLVLLMLQSSVLLSEPAHERPRPSKSG
jgi:hypothetical protein